MCFYRHEIPEMIACIEPLNSGFALSDPNDPRHQYMTSLKRRFGQFLHCASTSLQQQGEENTVDAVHMLVSYHPIKMRSICKCPIQVRSISTYMLEYGDSRDRYAHNQSPELF